MVYMSLNDSSQPYFIKLIHKPLFYIFAQILFPVKLQ